MDTEVDDQLASILISDFQAHKRMYKASYEEKNSNPSLIHYREIYGNQKTIDFMNDIDKKHNKAMSSYMKTVINSDPSEFPPQVDRKVLNPHDEEVKRIIFEYQVIKTLRDDLVSRNRSLSRSNDELKKEVTKLSIIAKAIK